MHKIFATILAMSFSAFAHAEPLQVEIAAPGIYVHHGVHKDINVGYGGDICNIGFIVGNKGVAVIDTGGSPKVGAQLREAIRKVTDLPILYVINTHVHPDHILGNAAFKDDHPTFVGHENLAAAMVQRKEVYLSTEASWVGAADAVGSEVISPTLAIKDTQTIDLGGRILQLTAYPSAHTDNDVVVFDSTTATLWTGDLLFIERTPSFEGDIKSWLKVIAQLRNIPAVRAIPGHGPVTVDWHGALDNESRYLSTLLGDVRASIKKGRSMEQSIDESTHSEQGKWVLFDLVNRRNIARIFPLLEWE
jgi:quinoprotein relay system zinc metallohydrolase 2